jgi:hypothetical protein
MTLANEIQNYLEEIQPIYQKHFGKMEIELEQTDGDTTAYIQYTGRDVEVGLDSLQALEDELFGRDKPYPDGFGFNLALVPTEQTTTYIPGQSGAFKPDSELLGLEIRPKRGKR